MNSVKKNFFIVLFLGLSLGIGFAQEQTGESSALTWKMALLKKNGSVYESVAFRPPLTMNRKDAFQVYLSFDSTGYCYVIQEDDRGKLPLVYRKAFSPGDSITLPGAAAGKDTGGGQDFLASELLGTSRLYVIVSAQPRQNLERLMDQYSQEPVTESLERSILSEVFAVRRNVTPRPEPSGRQDPERRSAASPPANPETPVAFPESDGTIKGQLWLFEGQDAWAVTVVVRVQ